MPKKIRVGILFGGKSAEHQVSLQSAKNIIASIDRKKYLPVAIGIDRHGRWHLAQADNFLQRADDMECVRLSVDSPVALIPESQGRLRVLSRPTLKKFVDVIFPVLHGTYGEDGTVQGLLRLANVPFVGAGVLGSAVGMDKDVMKRLLHEAGLPVGRFITLRKRDVISYAKVSRTLGKIVFVKPANLGSSIGISKVKNAKAFRTAVAQAFRYDTKILVEEYLPGREIECAVLGNHDLIASVPGEIIPQRDFYSYAAKYLDPDGAKLAIPAQLDRRIVAMVQTLARQTFRVLECAGLGRVDFFLTNEGKLFINEINTLPGFTSVSMYPKLFEASGISYAELIDRLITLAFERYADERKLETASVQEG